MNIISEIATQRELLLIFSFLICLSVLSVFLFLTCYVIDVLVSSLNIFLTSNLLMDLNKTDKVL